MITEELTAPATEAKVYTLNDLFPERNLHRCFLNFIIGYRHQIAGLSVIRNQERYVLELLLQTGEGEHRVRLARLESSSGLELVSTTSVMHADPELITPLLAIFNASVPDRNFSLLFQSSEQPVLRGSQKLCTTPGEQIFCNLIIELGHVADLLEATVET